MRNPLSRALVRLPALALTALVAGCSADIARFDFPTASLAEKPATTASLPTPPETVYNRSNLIGAETADGAAPAPGASSPGGAYYPAQSPGREPGLRMAALPDATRSAPEPLSATGGAPAAASQSLAASGAASAPAAATPPQAAASGEQIEVQPGDTLFGLSKRHNVSVAELMSVNNLSGPALKPGQKLVLPSQRTARPPLTKQQPAITAADAPSTWSGSYTVKPGDSLYQIARSNKINLTELQRYNGITDARRVKPGIVLKVPGSGEAPAATAPAGAATAPVVTAAAPASTLNDATAGAPSAAAAPSEQVSVDPPSAPKIINAAPSEPKVATLDTPTAAKDAARQTGTANAPASGSVAQTGKLRWPVQGKVIAGFGQRTDGTHNDGINLAVPLGADVHAAEGGVVAYAGNELKGYGNLILVRHDNGWVTAYAHAEELMVKRGDKVKRGQVIAKAGKTGQVDQPQLHFEVRQGQKPVDPTPFMEKL